MKRIKLIGGLALIPLGVFIGSFISIGYGNGAIIGGIIGGLLWCILNWSGPWNYSLDEQHQIDSNVNKEAISETFRGINQANQANKSSADWGIL